MATASDDLRMVRKQYYLSATHVRRLEALRELTGATSDAEVIRRAIDTFDSDALDNEDQQLVDQAARELIVQVEALHTAIDETLERSARTRRQINDPAWIETIRERTRREAESDPVLIAGVASLIGA